MRLLIDTDAFCKLAVGGLLHDALNLLSVDLIECGRLPALPYMLRKGRLRRLFGEDLCDKLIPLAESIPVADQPSNSWLDKLIDIHTIDPGEAQIMAAALPASMKLDKYKPYD